MFCIIEYVMNTTLNPWNQHEWEFLSCFCRYLNRCGPKAWSSGHLRALLLPHKQHFSSTQHTVNSQTHAENLHATFNSLYSSVRLFRCVKYCLKFHELFLIYTKIKVMSSCTHRHVALSMHSFSCVCAVMFLSSHEMRSDTRHPAPQKYILAVYLWKYESECKSTIIDWLKHGRMWDCVQFEQFSLCWGGQEAA